MTRRDRPALARCSTRMAFATIALCVYACQRTPPAPPSTVEQLLVRMTLEEKIGQMSQYAWGSLTGPASSKPGVTEALIREGRIGSLLNVTGTGETNRMQRIAVEQSRLGIPILFAYDTIHGYRTIFPVPLAMAATFDPSVAERAADVAARETRAAGIRWVFAPMVDVARDARWGRVVESFGEDVLLNRIMGAASVRGLDRHVVSCAKHFAAYGAAEAGRDYNTVDLSPARLRNVYLPPFESAVHAGVDSVMAGFHDLNGVPAHANRFLLETVLRQQWRFDGVVVSDYNGIGELIPHGVAADAGQAAELAVLAGVDMDMEGNVYATELAERVRAGRVPMSVVDDSVRRILRLKEATGLFDHPYGDAKAEEAAMVTDEHRRAAREIARAAIVLLKNEAGVLPLAGDVKRIALIGPLADSAPDCLGPWHGQGRPEDAVSILSALQTVAASREVEVRHAPGCPTAACSDTTGFAAAVAAARNADVVLAVVGESEAMSGEAASRTEIGLPGRQRDLLEAVVATQTPVVVILMNGRPLALPWAASHASALLETWFLGIEHGPAVVDILFGDAEPVGRLPISMPRRVGQLPLYYARRTTGRPADAPDAHPKYSSRYLDVENDPLYPFGFGLGYTTFELAAAEVVPNRARATDTVTVRVRVTNTGDRKGQHLIQVYARDDVSSTTPPVAHLVGFEHVTLAAGESRTVEVPIVVAELGTHHGNDTKPRVEPGTFTLRVGPDSVRGLRLPLTVAP